MPPRKPTSRDDRFAWTAETPPTVHLAPEQAARRAADRRAAARPPGRRPRQPDREHMLQLARARHARGLTQAELAQRLDTSQGEISRTEKEPDVLLSTIRHYVHALGGRLELTATFENHEPIPLHIDPGDGA